MEKLHLRMIRGGKKQPYNEVLTETNSTADLKAEIKRLKDELAKERQLCNTYRKMVERQLEEAY